MLVYWQIWKEHIARLFERLTASTNQIWSGIGMEALFAKNIVASPYFNPVRWNLTSIMLKECHRFPLNSKRANTQIGHSLIVPQSKGSMFQDFQGFAKPSRLLPVMEGSIYTNIISEETFSSIDLDKSNSFYMVELRTSNDFGSSLKDLNAGILLCLIDEDGNSILQRISAASLQYRGQGEQMLTELVHFQRGSFDIVTFKGSKLGKVEALWIGLESGSGSWRLDGIRLTIIFGPLEYDKSTEILKEGKFHGMQYEFEANNVLLGEGGVSLAELRPILVNELSQDNLSTMLNSNSLSVSPFTLNISNEESMREYADLKFSLLLYDFLLILGGSTILILLSAENAAYSFLIGGISGFLYLLLLQRSVDGLSAPSSTAEGKMGSFVRVLAEFKGPLLSLVLAVVAGAIAMNYGTGGSSMALSAIDLFVGVAGFLACKIAVLLAAFRPIKRSTNVDV